MVFLLERPVYQKWLKKSCLINYYSFILNGPIKRETHKFKSIEKKMRRMYVALGIRKGKKRNKRNLSASHQRIIEAYRHESIFALFQTCLLTHNNVVSNMSLDAN